MKILLIEDNPGDARLVQEILRECRASYSLVVAETLAQGLERLCSQAVDAALLDLNLPDSHGLDSISKLQARFPSLPIIILTSLEDEQLGTQAVQRGAQDYLVKGQVNSLLLQRTLTYAVERKSIVEALSEKEHFLELLAELNPAIIQVTDLVHNRPIYSSKSAAGGLATLLGYQREDAPAGDLLDFPASLLYPGDEARVAAAFAELPRTNDDVIRDITIRAKGADGRWRWLQVLFRIFRRDSSGVPSEVMSVTRDLTERMEAEEALQQRTDELEAINKELEAFSYSVSHDLRAPLHHIGGLSQTMAEKYGAALDEQGQDWLDLLRENVGQMERLLDALLMLSRSGRQPLAIQPVLPAAVVRRVIAALQPDLQSRQIRFAIGDPQASPEQALPLCMADPDLLQQVYANLISNAVKFTRRCPVASIEIGAMVRDGQHVYYVKDNGVGFDMKYADKLFGVFRRLHSDDEFEGTGAGLAIVQRIVRRHGGEIWAQGEVDKGATFYFTLAGTKPQNRSTPSDAW